MPDRPDVVLAAIPLFVGSGLTLQSARVVAGVSTGVLTSPLAVAGYLAALAIVFGELFVGPVADRTADS